MKRKINTLKSNRIKTVVDKDNNLNYEFNSVIKNIINLILIPILNILPRTSQKLVRKTHKSANELIEEKTTYYALEILYNKGVKENATSLINKIFHKIWFETNNAKAVRNRLRLTKREINKHLKLCLNYKEKIKIISIASGSARGIIEVLEENKHKLLNYKIEVTFIDKEYRALEFSKNFAKSKNIASIAELSWINDTAGSYFRSLNEDYQFDIVEMVGLIDYFSDKKAEKIFNYIYKHLSKNGILVTANIGYNKEKPFVTRVVGWDMIYRTPDKLANILTNAGFDENNINIMYEPLKIHFVATATK